MDQHLSQVGRQDSAPQVIQSPHFFQSVLFHSLGPHPALLLVEREKAENPVGCTLVGNMSVLLLLPTLHWLSLGHMIPLNCKGSWEMWPVCLGVGRHNISSSIWRFPKLTLSGLFSRIPRDAPNNGNFLNMENSPSPGYL